VLRLASAKVPQYADNFFKYGTNAAPQVKTLLPVEARMILEKVVRISEIRLALAKRDPALAASIAPWVTGSRFVILEPEQERDTSYYSRQPMAPVKALRWTRGGVVLGSRIKADLAELGGESFIDKGRAAMFTEELESRLTSDLR